ncbi:MAG: pseudaminic acid synthase [Halanaerobiales bacterium]
MSIKLKLGKKSIGIGEPTYIIAEMSANHANKIENAKKIIHAAKESGADCIKIQTYKPDTLTIDSDKECFIIDNGIWKGKKLYSLYEQAYTPWEWHDELKVEAENVDIDFFSTPYEKTSVDFLEEIGVEFYKVASFSITNIPFLEYLAKKNKPIILSTGMSTLGEIEEAVNSIKAQGNEKIALLKCSSAYPAVPEDMNIKTMNNLLDIFDVPVGLSDHSYGFISAVTAVALGANIIEKHFCLSRDIQTPDSKFSLEPEEFKEMVKNVRIAEKAVGEINYGLSDTEKNSRIFRKSIFVVKDIKIGEKFTENNIRIIRPGYGLKPKYYKRIIGKKATENIERGTPLTWDYIG